MIERKSYLEPSLSPHYDTAHQSHAGLVRPINEDRYIVREFTTSDPAPAPVLLAVLTDGVGGHRAGEIAAQIGADIVHETISTCHTLSEPDILLEKSVQKANQAVREYAAEHPEAQGMGATCVCVLLVGDRLYTGNLGDSRAYLLRRGNLNQITCDHTWLTDTPESANRQLLGISRKNPLAHVLTRYLGSPHPIKVDRRMMQSAYENNEEMRLNQGAQLKSGDRLLLCSDGLTDMLNDDQIQILASIEPLETAAKSLLDEALTAGGHDNISLILIEIP